MKIIHHESTSAGADATAQLAIEIAIRLMRVVKVALRESPSSPLSLPRLRTLAYVADNPGLCLSDIAEYLFVGVPTASKHVDHLVARGLLTRVSDTGDRRRMALTVTPEGKRTVTTLLLPAQARVGALLERLAARDLERVDRGLALVRDLLAQGEREVSGA